MSSIGPTGGPHYPQETYLFGASPSATPTAPDAAAFANRLLTGYGTELASVLSDYATNPNVGTVSTLLMVLKAFESDVADGGELIDKIKQAQNQSPPPAVNDLGTALEMAYAMENKAVLAQASITNATNVSQLPSVQELEGIIGNVSPNPDPKATGGTLWGDLQVLNNALSPSQKPPPPFFALPSTGNSPQIQGESAYDAATTIQSQSIGAIQAAFAAYQANPNATNASGLLKTLLQAEKDIRNDTSGLIETLEAQEGAKPDSKLMGAIAQSYNLGSLITSAENMLITAGQQGTLPDMGALSTLIGGQNSKNLNTIWGNINNIVDWLKS